MQGELLNLPQSNAALACKADMTSLYLHVDNLVFSSSGFQNSLTLNFTQMTGYTSIALHAPFVAFLEDDRMIAFA